MSLSTQLRGALGPVVGRFATEFGDPATWRRPSAGTRKADGSLPSTATTMGTGVRVIVKPISTLEAEKQFGREADVSAIGLLRDSIALQARDRFAFTSGPLLETGFEYEVVSLTPEPAGGVFYNIGLKRVPALP